MPGKADAVNILLVDDKPNNLVALESFLAAPGYRLVTATSGAAALECLKRDEFAVILADVMMPIMDGFELAARVNAHPEWRTTPIIFLTAMASEISNVFRGYEVGAVDFLQKPLEPDIVKAKVAVFVQLYRQRVLIRHQSQEIVKAAVRDNARKSRIEKLQTVHLEVTRLLSEATTAKETIPALLKTIAKGFGWQWAAFWTPDPASDMLVATDVWHHGSSLQLAHREATTLKTRLARGQDAPGRVWESGKPEWLDAATRVVIPISASGQVVGVFEFFSRRKLAKDRLTRAIVNDIGTRVGIYLQRLKTEQTLKESEEKFRLLVGGVKEYSIMMLDCAGHVTTWNDGAKRLNLYGADEIIGKSFERFFTEEAIEQGIPKMELERAIRDGQVESEGLRVRKDGTTFYANAVITALRDDAGTLRGFVKTTRDITDRRLADESLTRAYAELDARVKERTADLEAAKEELRSAKELAEAASLAKSAFLANMSHEIRTPLGAVMGFSELLLVPDTSPSERANFVEAIKRNGKLLTNIINDILDLSKVEAGRLDVERVMVPLDEILSDVKALLAFEAVEKGLKLKLSTEGEVPARITTDPLRLRQILLNIVGNAIKFTDRGSIELSIAQFGAGDGRKMLSFVVKDTGRGISADQALKLFEPFAQADSSTTRRFGGTGLGLALSKQLANALGGDVKLVESGVGRGSTFSVTIDPGETVTESDYVIAAMRGAAQTRMVDLPVLLSHLKILLAEDSPDNQLLISRMLRTSGAKVDIVSNGIEAVEKARLNDYHVVLMDLQMPEMDGYAATRELRAGGYRSPIVALTAHAMAEERRRCLESGFDAHLSKPINRNTLLQCIVEFGAQGTRRHGRLLEGMSVLVVDDEPDALTLVSKVLQRSGAEVTAVASVDDAMDALETAAHDVLLSDIAMPGKDGLELIRMIRRSGGRSAAMPAAALTAFARPEERKEALAAGFQAHLAKPVEPDALVAALADLARHT